MNVKVRQAHAHDWPQLLGWVRAFHAHHALEQPPGGLDDAVRTLLDNAHLGCIWIIQAGADQRPVGYLAICYGYSIEFGGRDAFIDEFYIEPDSRGEHIGRAALAQVIDATRAAGIRALHLEVAHDNAAAGRLYAHLGFDKREHYRLMTLLLAAERS